MSIDGKVSNLNRDVFTALQGVKDPKQMTAAETQNLRTAILKDKHIDAAESDLLQELTQDSHQSISIGAQKSPDFSPQDMSFGPAQGPNRQSLQALRTHPDELNRLWNGGKDGMAELVKLYGGPPVARNMVMGFVGNQFKEAWTKSNVSNGYAPLRESIAKAYATVNSDDPAAARNGRLMLYDAAQNLDRYVSGTIPDFLYNWLKPTA
ncbi:MAG: hypothetical protein ACAI44_08605 [Candidatus Sericytochromatia bacterium]